MNSKAKGLRIAGGVSILLNIIIFFLPIAKYEPMNYPIERFSQWDYVVNVFSPEAPYGAVSSTGRFMWMFLLILVPLIVSLVAGIWKMVGDDRQIVSNILIFVVFGLYMLLFLSIGSFFPEQEYQRDIAGICNLLGSAVASLLALFALLSKEEKTEEAILTDIPQVQEIKQEQVKAKYNIITEEKSINPFDSSASAEAASGSQIGQQTPQQPNPASQMPQQSYSTPQDAPPQASALPAQVIPPYVPGPPKGVMVGLTGIYTGAVISFRDGESIRLGRMTDNDLIFDGQDKVSRNHCYIKWNGTEQKFLIKDSSSNGTFVNGSEDCLPRNIEIEVPIGSVLAIGDERNTFRLE
ncbi:MAG: FHA domain-containing protein [Lachnospiraceae bacterium]|nr:FHA domain-containing protein [Lachnospiraceae bacterium]